MNAGQTVRLLIDYRYHKKGHIGLIDKQLNETCARVDLNWNQSLEVKNLY